MSLSHSFNKRIIQQNSLSKLEHKIQIVPFQSAHQNAVICLMESIALEFKEPIFSSSSKKIIDFFELPNHQFWVALNDSKLVGTIGILKLSNGNMVLKSMFVAKMCRGQGVSSLLLHTAMAFVIQNHSKQIYLGTMNQFTDGQRFYEKNGFVKCKSTDLPTDFTINPLDSIFYTKQLL